MTVIERIDICIAEKGISGAELCRAIGLSSGVYSQWHNGSSPSNKNLAKIAEYFNVPVEWLMFGGKKENSPAVNTDWATLEQQELMRIISRLSPAAVSNLLGTARMIAALEEAQAAKE